MDFVLLCTAKAAVKNTVGYLRIAVASAVGAFFAVCFPLFGLGGAWATVVKLVFGLVITAIGGKFSCLWGYVKFSVAFYAFSLLCGGALIAVFSLSGVPYAGGNGFVISSVPVGIPLFLATLTFIVVKKIAKKRIKNGVIEVKCKIYLNERVAFCNAFYDSGNKLYLGGTPVSVLPKQVALRLVDQSKIKLFVAVHTVTGQAKLSAFFADKIEISSGEKTVVKSNVLLAISPKYQSKAVLHSDLMEVS